MSRFLQESPVHKRTGVWFSSDHRSGKIKKLKWGYQSDNYLHQRSGYREPKRGSRVYWFETLEEAEDYSMSNLKEKVKRSKASYERDLRVLRNLAYCNAMDAFMEKANG